MTLRQTSRGSGGGEALAAVLVLAAFLSLGGVGLFRGPEPLVTAFHDDAFYYFGVARNLAEGHGFTFDGLHRTNGFHPLWLSAVVPVFRLFPSSDTAPLRAILLLQIALVAWAMLALFTTLQPRIGREGSFLAALTLTTLPGATTGLAAGMESSLFLLLLVLTWRAWVGPAEGPVAWLGIGVLCAALFLVRLEAIAFVPAFVLLGRERLRAPWALLSFLAPPALTTVLYLIWSRALFGTWLPVSALVKSHWASRAPFSSRLLLLSDIPWPGQEMLVRAFGQAQLFSGSPWLPVLNGLLLAGVVAAAWRWRVFLRQVVRESGGAFLLTAAVVWIAVNKLALSYLERWNRVPILLASAVLLGSILSRRASAARLAAAVLLLFVILRAPWAAMRATSSPAFYGPYRYRAALWLREHLDEDARIGSWNAGTLGYFSHRHVVNLDGLVNDREYLERVIKGRSLAAYLDDERIDWLADQACGPSPRPALYLARTGSEGLDTQWTLRAQLHRGEDPAECPGYTIWSRGSGGNGSTGAPPAPARPEQRGLDAPGP